MKDMVDGPGTVINSTRKLLFVLLDKANEAQQGWLETWESWSVREGLFEAYEVYDQDESDRVEFRAKRADCMR